MPSPLPHGADLGVANEVGRASPVGVGGGTGVTVGNGTRVGAPPADGSPPQAANKTATNTIIGTRPTRRMPPRACATINRDTVIWNNVLLKRRSLAIARRRSRTRRSRIRASCATSVSAGFWTMPSMVATGSAMSTLVSAPCACTTTLHGNGRPMSCTASNACA